ncbi:nitroreductase family deazaflavin-dependent oxidoreductase [Pseudonocardia oroxyli]|uniref:Deazaflavin-dependent oxidoreductase, nitroreductase family n=1 Tax=Pseudonocardia oroxyli TaxID=366584 RepID=A0A1G8A021_PSEOR|nr:nitroreductase family deazaflavin-dependent oxidoreductase [Pseudonocardia oroxyli]SDH14262.1 deazaflavin-dependent oxidoreductase, nitroreductase family [Pseudonocardia oroxyli]
MPEDFNSRVIREFKENDGKVGPPFEGADMILVHHKGAKSGTVRTTPLVYFTDGDTYLIVASAAGAPSHPAWYHNVKAHPEIEVELGKASGGVTPLTVRAEELTGPDRDAAYERIVAAAPGFGDYAEKTEGIRTIPVFALTPAA